MIKTKHIFQLSRIVDKMQVKEEMQDIFEGSGKKKISEQALGVKITMALITKMHLAETETISLLAEMSGKTKESIQNQAFKETFEMIKAMLSEEGVLDFLNSQQVV